MRALQQAGRKLQGSSCALCCATAQLSCTVRGCRPLLSHFHCCYEQPWCKLRSPEVARHVQALMVAVEHVHRAALLPRLPVQLTQQQHRACRAGKG